MLGGDPVALDGHFIGRKSFQTQTTQACHRRRLSFLGSSPLRNRMSNNVFEGLLVNAVLGINPNHSVFRINNMPCHYTLT